MPQGNQKRLQQYLPLAVLKHLIMWLSIIYVNVNYVATVLTACGIETRSEELHHHYLHHVATVLTACGIETY